MRKVIVNSTHLILILIFIIASTVAVAPASYTVYAEGEEDGSGYTEEQKNAAKAWLSAHGYAPTRAGAAQAYADYLAGKLDNDPDVRRYKGLDDVDSTETETDDNVGTAADIHLTDDDTGTEEGVADNEASQDSSSSDSTASTDANDSSVDLASLEDILEDNDIDSELASYGSRLKLVESDNITLLLPEEESKDNNTFLYILSGLSIIIVIVAVTVLLHKPRGV